MSNAASFQTPLAAQFAEALPELSRPWQPTAWPQPEVVTFDEAVAAKVGMSGADLRDAATVDFLTGSVLPEGAEPVATAYAGHQFGQYSPLLGDGRAVLLGELTAPDGSQHDLYLKGSGPTDFSRGGDGFAALGPMLREHLVSSAMHALGVPTSRSLAVVITGRHVRREEWLPGAVLARVASSHLRVGTFQLVRSTGDTELLKRLVAFAIERHVPTAKEQEQQALKLLDHVVEAQARLVAQWMLLGFVHGVMNTDNMTISGETIDYGPCAFMERYDERTTFSSIDSQGRYRYGNQPGIAQWNLSRFAETLLPLIDADEGRAIEQATASVSRFATLYRQAFVDGMRGRLGLATRATSDDVVAELADDLFSLLADARADLTGTLRGLGGGARGDVEPLESHIGAAAGWPEWRDSWLSQDPDGEAADRANPAYVPRNHLVEHALDAATGGDMRPFEQLLARVTTPFDRVPGQEAYERASDAADFREYTTYCGT